LTLFSKKLITAIIFVFFMEPLTATKIIARGLVQGVFFRVSAREEALSLGLKGYVKNSADGEVEIVVSGKEDDIEAFIAWSYIGPVNAKVDDVEVEGIIIDKEFEDFKIIYD
jgi:acylphosphatase